MGDRVRTIIEKVCDVIEILIALAVCVGLVISFILFLPDAAALMSASGDTQNFLAFIEAMFSFIVGVEFIKMLLKPSAENVIEVLVFLVARHMILETSTAVDLLLSVISVAVLFAVRLMLRYYRQRFHDSEI